MGADEFRDSDGDEPTRLLGNPTGSQSQPPMMLRRDNDSDLLPALSEYQLDTDPNSANTVVTAADRGAWSSDRGSCRLGHEHAHRHHCPAPTAPFFIFDLGSSLLNHHRCRREA